jgi:hypothetical protein
MRFPKTVTLLVTVRELRVVTPCKDTLFETTNALRVVVPTGTLKPPVDTVTLFVTTNELRVVVPVAVSAPEMVTLHPAPGARTMFDVAEIWRFDEAFVVIDPAELISAELNTARMKIPEPPLPPLVVFLPPPPPPDPLFSVALPPDELALIPPFPAPPPPPKAPVPSLPAPPPPP